MKKIIFAVLMLAFAVSANAQYKQFNVGLGLDGKSIPVFIGLDFPVAKNFTLGGEIGWRRYNDNIYWNNKKYDYYEQAIHFLFNGNYHFGEVFKLPKQLDIYAGGNIGFVNWSNNWDSSWGNSDHSSGLGLGAQVGIRYYFNDKLGVYLEICQGNQVSAQKVGLSIRF